MVVMKIGVLMNSLLIKEWIDKKVGIQPLLAS
jgi:hypothetical protein